MNKISLCMIVKNEEDVLERCLTSVRDIIDEIIIVDTGSTDRTKEVATTFSAKIYEFAWCDDFSAARNYAFSKATKDFILWLDADDVIEELERVKLLELKKELSNKIDVVMLKYNVGFDKNGEVNFSFYRERILRRAKQFKWVDPIHEYIETSGNVIIKDIAVTHRKIHANTGRNLRIYEGYIEAKKELSPRSLYYYGKELYENKRYCDAVIQFNKYLLKNEGWVEDKISACFFLSICYELLGDKDNMQNVLFKSFNYDVPRAEICCRIGNYFEEKSCYYQAIFWYELATKLKKPDDFIGFLLHDYNGYYPHIQMCVCYDRLGRYEDAKKHNELAGKYKPNDQAVAYNKEYFEDMKVM
jgi:glycosyltransferase involved in cell wall biosynthesis